MIVVAQKNFAPNWLMRCGIIERGDLTPGQMIGAWAGEIGHFDGNYLKSNAWTAGKPWTDGSAILRKWNESEVYAKTVAYFATRLAKEP